MTDPFSSLHIRPGAPGDLNRVRKDWAASYAASRFARYLTPLAWTGKPSELYWDVQRGIIGDCLARAQLWIASWKENPTTIVGWVCRTEWVHDEPVVHYVYVKEVYRARGVAKLLLAPVLESRTGIYTHRPPLASHLPIPPGWRFDPRPALMR